MIGHSVDYIRVAAIVELQDAQGWQSISETPRYRAQIDFVEIKSVDVYTLIVDKIDLTDDVPPSDSVIFTMDKALSDDSPAIEAIIFDMTKPFSDSAPADESIIFQMDKPFSDNVSNSDSTLFSTNKALSESVPPTDSVIFNMITDGDGGVNSYTINEVAIGYHKKTVKVFSV